MKLSHLIPDERNYTRFKWDTTAESRVVKEPLYTCSFNRDVDSDFVAISIADQTRIPFEIVCMNYQRLHCKLGYNCRCAAILARIFDAFLSAISSTKLKAARTSRFLELWYVFPFLTFVLFFPSTVNSRYSGHPGDCHLVSVIASVINSGVREK